MKEKRYYVKLGKLYIKELYIDSNEIDSYFIKEIELTTNKEKVYYKIYEEERNTFLFILDQVLFNVNGDAYNFIEFEEVEEENEY